MEDLTDGSRRRARPIKPRGPQRGTRAIYGLWDSGTDRVPKTPYKYTHAKGASLQANRARFWTYCQRVAMGARERAGKKGFPYAIDAYFVDKLIVDQKFKCAITGLPLVPIEKWQGSRRHPFGPSLDRIVPSLGYVPGNLRVIAMCVNIAISDWGEDAFYKVVKACAEKAKRGKPLWPVRSRRRRSLDPTSGSNAEPSP